MAELEAGVLRAILARVAEQGALRMAEGLESVAEAIERQARANASNGQHDYGTPTPARPGEGPAQISGTLVESIGHNPVERSIEGWATKVGPRRGHYPEYSSRWRSRVDSSRYGYYLETGDHGITYPWLKPAADAIGEAAVSVAVLDVFNDISWG